MAPEGATVGVRGEESAFDAYETLAPYYDRYTLEYDHASWLTALEAWARAEGLQGRRLLDIACGTGKSFRPLEARGYAVTACDLSPRMVARARARGGPGARVLVADMRDLPWHEEFDLVTCINDAINYLLSLEDLKKALACMARALAPHGIAIFDANSLKTFRSAFAQHATAADSGYFFEWQGRATSAFQTGEIARATLTVMHGRGLEETEHVQRHWPVDALRRECLHAGFRRVVVRGQLPGAQLMDAPDETQHTKVVVLAARSDRLLGPDA